MSYEEIIRDNESLGLFMASLSEFDQFFCDRMATGDDFTIKLEVHGCKGELIHSRVENLGFKRPHGVERRVEQKKR